jgi:hypothetical protein
MIGRKSNLGAVTPARTLILTSVAGVILALLSLMVVQAASRPAHAASDRLPDLGMARFKALQTRRADDGRRLLRFSSIIVNVGAGRFEARGWRPGTGTNTMRVKQRIYNDAGRYRDARTGAVMYFAGGREGDDGHYHWHIRNLQKFKLVRLDNGRKVGTIAKHGFCFFDNYRYGSNRAPFYTTARGACGDSPPTCESEWASRGVGATYTGGTCQASTSTSLASPRGDTGSRALRTQPVGSGRETTPTTPPGSTSSLRDTG